MKKSTISCQQLSYLMSHVKSKHAFCICKLRGADQLRGYHAADQCFFFCYIDSTAPLLPQTQNVMPLAIFCGCTARFVLDLVGNPEDRFSQDMTHYHIGKVTLNCATCSLSLCTRTGISWNLTHLYYLPFHCPPVLTS